jgi:hypothetical protein
VNEYGEPTITEFGGVPLIVGARLVAVAAAVVNDQVDAADSALPATSLTPVVTWTVYEVPAARGADGVKVATFVASATLPATAALPAVLGRREIVVVFTVAGLSASLKVTRTLAFVATPVALGAGSRAEIVGATVSAT